MATVEELTAEVARLRVNLKASEQLRAMEAQAVARAIRQPGEPLPPRLSVICALRGVTLPEDFLPVAERILVENEELRKRLRWIPLEERAPQPKDLDRAGCVMLAALEPETDKCPIAPGWLDDGIWRWESNGELALATHWQPMPAAPNET